MLRRMMLYLLCFALVMSACGNDDENSSLVSSSDNRDDSATTASDVDGVAPTEVVSAGGMSASTATTVELVATLGNGSAIDLAWSPDNRSLLIAGGKGIWRHEVGGSMPTLYEHYFYPMTFSQDGSLVASLDSSGAVVLWDPNTGELVETVVEDLENVSRIRFMDEQVVLLASGAVSVWDAGNEIASLAIDGGLITDVALRTDGQLIALGADEETQIKLWNVLSADVIAETDVITEAVYGVRLSPDGRLAVVPITQPGPEEGMFMSTGVRLYDTTTGEEIRTLDERFSITLSPDSTVFATTSRMGDTIELIDMQTDEAVQLGDEPVRGIGYRGRWFQTMRFSPDGTRFADIDNTNVVEMWDARTGQSLGTLDIFTGDAVALDFHEDVVVVAYRNGPVRWWDLARRQVIEEIPMNWVNDVAVSPDGDWLACGSGDVQRWRLGAGEPEVQMPLGGYDSVEAVAFSPDGNLLAFGATIWGSRSRTRESQIRIWNMAADTLAIPDIKAHDEAIQSMVFSPDGSLLASSNLEEGIRLWSVESGELVLALETGAADIAFSPDGQVLASVDQAIQLWDVDSGELLNSFEPDVEYMRVVIYSQDGSLLAVAGAGRVLLVDATTGEVLKVFENLSVSDFAFSPDGDTLVGAGMAGTVFVWRSS